MSTHILAIMFHHAKSQANLGRYPSQGLGKGMRAKHTCGAKPDWVVTVTVVCGFTPLSAIILLLDLSPTFHSTTRRCPAPASSTRSPPQRLLSPHCTGRPVRASRQRAGLPRSGSDHPHKSTGWAGYPTLHHLGSVGAQPVGRHLPRLTLISCWLSVHLAYNTTSALNPIGPSSTFLQIFFQIYFFI